MNKMAAISIVVAEIVFHGQEAECAWLSTFVPLCDGVAQLQLRPQASAFALQHHLTRSDGRYPKL